MKRSLLFRLIVLPQAMRAIIPPTGNELIGMLKNTSLVSVIAAEELLTKAQIIYAGNFKVIELLIVAAFWSPKAGAGFLHIDERWVDASPFVDRLGRAIVDAGGRVVEGARVTSVRETSSEVVVHSSAGNHAADHVVIAAGVWSEDICRELGVRLGMQPGKGYSFSVGGAEIPRRLLYFGDAHAVATPIDGRVRIAGTMEFDGTRERFNRRRVEAMVRAVSPLLPGLDWSDVADEWVAPRPMTPDGLPLIGWLHGSRRVLVASGHNMLGLTLGPPTGRLIAGLVCDEAVAVDLQPFSPGRFASVHSGDRTGRAMWRKSPA